ncbi:MAG: GspE/PulE family protein, partial [bacterium]
GFQINSIISEDKEIQEAIGQIYPDVTTTFVDEILKEISDTSIELIKEEDGALPSIEELSRSSREAPVIKVTDAILESGVKKKASDILIEPQKDTLRLRFRIDGVLLEQNAPAKSMHPLIVSRIKVMSDLNIAEHRLPQEGRLKAAVAGREVDFRISVLPSSWGEKVAIRILDKNQAMLDIEKLGFDSKSISLLEKASLYPHGMILVCGPTGSGKTTTLYSILKFVDSPRKNIVTVEDPVEYQLEGINQITVNSQIGLSFASALRSILRQDPNVIMVGEIRDLDTVDIAIKAALTGHLVLSTLHTTTTAGAVARLLNMGAQPYLISASLVSVVAQRLVRKICPHCKEEYRLKPEIAKRLKLNMDKEKSLIFFRGKGCRQCFDSGYSGRAGIIEVLSITPAIRELIVTSVQEHVIKQKARQDGMRTLRENGLALAWSGVTSLEEIVRVTAADE